MAGTQRPNQEGIRKFEEKGKLSEIGYYGSRHLQNRLVNEKKNLKRVDYDERENF